MDTFAHDMRELYDYIDELSAEERDRIIEAQEWITGMLVHPCNPAQRCLVGHVRLPVNVPAERADPLGHSRAMHDAHQDVTTHIVGSLFDSRVRQYGLKRVVTALKHHAASLKTSDITPAEETNHAAPIANHLP